MRATNLFRSHLNMIMFRGKLTVSPNTLNNEIHTYFFAHQWQKWHTESEFARKNKLAEETITSLQKMEKVEPVEPAPPPIADDYSYQRWMELIKNVSEFNRFYVECYKEAFPSQSKNLNIMDYKAFKLFHDWDVWGDGTSYPQLKATAVLDTTKNDPIQLLEDDLHLTTKMGSSKCIVANQDTDSQGMSKLFAFTLSINQQLKLHINPSICRQIYFRTVDAQPWTPSKGVHWFGNGKTQLLHGNVDHTEVKWPLNLLYKRVFEDQKRAQEEKSLTEMRMLQYRYNHPTKVSSVVGYLMNTQGNEHEYINHNWRIVKVTSNEYSNPNPANNLNGNYNKETEAEVFLRNIEFGQGHKGILLDVSAAIMEANDKDFLPALPFTFAIRIFHANYNQLIAQYSLHDQDDIKKLFHNQAGLLIIRDKTLPEGVPIQITIKQTVRSTMLQDHHQNIQVDFKGKEQVYNLEIKDRFLKTQRQLLLYGEQAKVQQGSDIDDKSSTFTMYKNYVQYELKCTNYGKPFTGKVTMDLDTDFDIDGGGLTQYTTNLDYLKKKGNNVDPPRARIQKLIAASQKFRDTFASYESINKLVYQNKLDKIITLTNGLVAKFYHQTKLQHGFYECCGSNRIFRPFRLSFQPNQEQTKRQVQFKNGAAKVSIYLNKDLTEDINPRHPAIESLCLQGLLKIDGKQAASFTALFFQNPSKNPFYRIDWQHVVGPKLRLMGLMYPSMQNIVNLYNYDGLSMQAMRRAFEIEDERHSRYMPATREMSSGTHRQIRRWLYNPIYDSQITVLNSNRPLERPISFTFKNFDEGKQQLIDLMKGAFKLELTTISLYLSAMFSITIDGEATKLIRSVAKDEMKHLFIVSNILNALGVTPPYPTSDSGPVDSVPTFPIQAEKDIMCFHFQLQKNQEWRKLMNPLPIQSSTCLQLLRFIMIEMPGEAYAIEIIPRLVDPQTKTLIDVAKPDCDCTTIFCNCNKTRTTFQERKYRIYLLKEALQAVVREMAAKQIETEPQPGLNNEFMTIGMAYEKITDYLWVLSDMDHTKLFNGENSKQFTYMYLDNMTEVINLRTALEQIRLITEEGEGSSIFTVTGEINKSSHFVKFIEIFTGCDLDIISKFIDGHTPDSKFTKRTAQFILTPNEKRFPDFPNYSKVVWDPYTDSCVDNLVNSELALERLSDRLEKTKFPNTYAPRSFLNNYVKILQEIGFIFTTDPKKFKSSDGLTFEETRLRSLENAVARMRQMSLNSTHIIHPNDTFDRKYPRHPDQEHPQYPKKRNPAPKTYPSAGPKFNLKDSQWLPKPEDQQ